MSKVAINMTMSLDGFVAGPEDGADHPLGRHGGARLFDALPEGLLLERLSVSDDPYATHLRYPVAKDPPPYMSARRGSNQENRDDA